MAGSARRYVRRGLIGGLVALCVAGISSCHHGDATTAATVPPAGEVTDKKASQEAFLAAYTVFMHPRCMNCHPSGDAPLQGEDSHIHTQNVRRGPDGRGLYALKCQNCHQSMNQPGQNMPAGNPKWRMPPANMKMVFQGKTAAELARQLKDPAETGGKTLEEIVEHSATDSLVVGCWAPGDGRATPPMSHEAFAQAMRDWVRLGAEIPE